MEKEYKSGRIKVHEQEFYMDGYLQSNLSYAKDIIKKDWDMLFIIDGREGSGKSVLAMQMAYYCDPNFDISRIVFTPNQLRKAIVEAKPFQALIYDEAYTGLSSRAAMSLINRTLVKMFAEIRQKNLFVFVVMPCFFDLDKYMALWRGRALIHVYATNFERGFFSFYNADRKKNLYIQGKKYYNYFKPNPNFRGRFTNHYTVDEKEYRKNKKNALVVREENAEKQEQMKELQQLMFIRMTENEKINKKIPNHIKAQVIGISESTYYIWLKRFNETGEI